VDASSAGTLYEEEFYFFQIFISIGELHVSQAPWQKQARPILIPYKYKIFEYFNP
jgi:hypothetical protein